MSYQVKAPLRLSLLLSVPVWCAFVADGRAACTNNPPANGQTVDCTGVGNAAVIAPIVANTGLAGVTGVTVNVGSGASVTGVGLSATGVTTTAGVKTGLSGNNEYSSISVNDSSAVNIAASATVAPTLPVGNQQRDYVGVNLNGSNTTLTNNGTITLANPAPLTTPGSATYRLYGVISSVPTSLPGIADNTVTFENVQVTNNGTISISQTASAVARAIYAGEGIDSMNIDNYGTISVSRLYTGAANTSQVAGIDSDDDVDELKVVNHANANITVTGNNTFGVGGRAKDYTFINSGTVTAVPTLIGATTVTPRGAIVIYGGNSDDNTSATAKIVNRSAGVINGNVVITDNSPLGAAAGPGNIGTVATNTNQTRDSTFNNQGTVNGAFAYGTGTHVLNNSGTITGPIFVQQTAAVGIGGASFTLKNSGTLGGDITITDRSDSVNDITLKGTGFSGSVIASNGTGDNSLTLNGVTNLTSVQGFRNLDLKQSNVAVSGSVSLQANANLATTIYGPGGTMAAPSTNVGTINGTLTLAGATTVAPTYKTLVHDGDVYQVASAVAGAGASQVTVKNGGSALVKSSADTSTGKLLLVTDVRSANSVSGLNQPSMTTLNGLLTYTGTNAQVLALGGAVENLPNDAAVRAAANALAPIVNGADIQTVVNSALLFDQQIDSRLDSFLYAEIPSSGRSADLGVSRPTPVYGALPTSGAWIEGIGGGVHQGTVAGTPGYTAELEGVIGGYDRLIVPGLRVGGAFGYIDGRVNGQAAIGSRENIQTYQGLAYATWEQPSYYLRGSVGYGGVNFQSTRQVAFAAFTDVATGSHSGNVLTARGEGGVPFEYRGNLLVPYAAFTYARLEQSAYTESSANGAAFAFGSASNDSDRSEVGGKIVVPLGSAPVFATLFPAGSVVALEGRAAYVHEFGNVAQTVSASFVGGGNVFVAAGPTPGRDMVDYGLGLRMGSGPVQFDLSYNGLARSSYLQQVGVLRARYMF